MYNNPRHQLQCIWHTMLARCYKPHCKDYKYYGARGITVHSDWHAFENFASDMSPHPGKGYELERVNNALGYSKANVIWARAIVNKRNRRGCLSPQVVNEIKHLHRNGQWPRGSVSAYARKHGVGASAISKIVHGHSWT